MGISQHWREDLQDTAILSFPACTCVYGSVACLSS